MRLTRRGFERTRSALPSSLLVMPLLLILSLAGFASALSFRCTDPMVPQLAADLDVGVDDAALLAAAFAIPYAAMQIVLGPLADAFGKARLIRICMIIFASGLALSALAPNYLGLAASRVMTGAFAGGVIPVAMALIGDRVALAERQIAISRFLASVIIGQLAGAAGAGALSDALGWRSIFAAASATAFLAAGAAFIFLKPGSRPAAPFSVRVAIARYAEVLRHRSALLVLGAVLGEGILFFGAFPFLAPILGGTGAAGLAISAFALGGVLYSVLAASLLRAFGSARMMRAGAVAGGVGIAALAFPLPPALLFGLFGVAGLSFYMYHNVLQTEATELAPTARASALALFAASLFAGQGAGTVIVASSAEFVGFDAVFLAAGLLIGGLGLAAAAALRPL